MTKSPADGSGTTTGRADGRDEANRPAAPRRPTIIDVAARAGVSKSVVSRVMRGAMWVSSARTEAVRAAAAELGYRPNAVARSLVQRRSFNVGVMIADLHNFITYSYLTEVLNGISSVASARGYHLLISTGYQDAAAEAAELERLLELRVDGVLLIDTMLSAHVVRAASQSMPVVVVRRWLRSAGIDTVNPNDAHGSELAVEHLAGLGHRRIAFVGGRGQRSAARERGYLAAMRRLGLADLIQIAADEFGFTEEGGYRGARALLRRQPRPTAICTVNDLSAVGALSAISEAGLRAPDDVSLVGYGNTALAALRHISLTTVDQPRREMGERAMTLLLERMERPAAPVKRLLFEPRIVARSTTAHPPSE